MMDFSGNVLFQNAASVKYAGRIEGGRVSALSHAMSYSGAALASVLDHIPPVEPTISSLPQPPPPTAPSAPSPHVSGPDMISESQVSITTSAPIPLLSTNIRLASEAPLHSMLPPRHPLRNIRSVGGTSASSTSPHTTAAASPLPDAIAQAAAGVGARQVPPGPSIAEPTTNNTDDALGFPPAVRSTLYQSVFAMPAAAAAAAAAAALAGTNSCVQDTTLNPSRSEADSAFECMSDFYGSRVSRRNSLQTVHESFTAQQGDLSNVSLLSVRSGATQRGLSDAGMTVDAGRSAGAAVASAVAAVVAGRDQRIRAGGPVSDSGVGGGGGSGLGMGVTRPGDSSTGGGDFIRQSLSGR